MNGRETQGNIYLMTYGLSRYIYTYTRNAAYSVCCVSCVYLLDRNEMFMLWKKEKTKEFHENIGGMSRNRYIEFNNK